MKIFDAHFHIINRDYPLVANNGFIPSAFSVADYKNRLAKADIIGGTVVAASFQTTDQSFMVSALNNLGPNYYGVANIPVDISASDLINLDNAGITAVRFNLKRSGHKQLSHMDYLSNKLYNELGWHTELYIDSKHIKEMSSTLAKLPTYSIDHLGLSKSGLDDLYKLVENGIKIKATGFGRLDFDPIPVMKKIYSLNPEALMFGTDLPSTRAKTPFSDDVFNLIQENFTDTEQENIFYKNALAWYRK